MMMDDLLADGVDAGVELPVPYADISRTMDRAMDSLQEVKESCLVHWDLWDGNVFIHERRVKAVVDFERAFWGDPLIESYLGGLAAPMPLSEDTDWGQSRLSIGCGGHCMTCTWM